VPHISGSIRRSHFFGQKKVYTVYTGLHWFTSVCPHCCLCSAYPIWTLSILLQPRQRAPSCPLLFTHVRTRLNTHPGIPGQGTSCPPTLPCPQRQACQELLHRPSGIRTHHPEYVKRLTSGMFCVVSLSFEETMPWTDSECCGSLPPRRPTVARHQPSRRSHFQYLKQ
jgi:hypothetical protein